MEIEPTFQRTMSILRVEEEAKQETRMKQAARRAMRNVMCVSTDDTVISQERELFINTAVRTSNSTETIFLQTTLKV
jgi:hypothetical protein